MKKWKFPQERKILFKSLIAPHLFPQIDTLIRFNFIAYVADYK